MNPNDLLQRLYQATQMAHVPKGAHIEYQQTFEGLQKWLADPKALREWADKQDKGDDLDT